MKLFAFDDSQDWQLLPLAARRALDWSGLRLSRQAWRDLSLEQRRALTRLGSERSVDVAACRELAETGAEPSEVFREASATELPESVVDAYAEFGSLSDKIWSALSPLERYALTKVASGRDRSRLSPAYREIVGDSEVSTHLAPGGGVRMVDVGDKPKSQRLALAESRVSMNEEAFSRLSQRSAPKGDVLSTARLAGIMAAKRTSDLIPLCHPLALTKIAIELELQVEPRAVRIVAQVEAFDRTGVEMEALTAASVAALTVYDMLKAFDKGMQLGPTRLIEKRGGQSQDYRA